MEEITWVKDQLKNEQISKSYRTVSTITNLAIMNAMNVQSKSPVNKEVCCKYG